jgi:hypothetical protein
MVRDGRGSAGGEADDWRRPQLDARRCARPAGAGGRAGPQQRRNDMVLSSAAGWFIFSVAAGLVIIRSKALAS